MFPQANAHQYVYAVKDTELFIAYYNVKLSLRENVCGIFWYNNGFLVRVIFPSILLRLFGCYLL